MAGALEAFFRSYYDPLCAVAGRYVECSDGAEDVVQDVFTLLWERPSLWQGCKEPRRYLYVAVRPSLTSAHMGRVRRLKTGRQTCDVTRHSALPSERRFQGGDKTAQPSARNATAGSIRVARRAGT